MPRAKVFLLTVLLIPAQALAEGRLQPADKAGIDPSKGPPEAVPRPPPERDWRLFGYLGGYGAIAGEGGGGLSIGPGFQYRYGAFVGGALLDIGGAPVGPVYAGAALLGGFGVRPLVGLRLELLALIGGRGYMGVGSEWGSYDPGASAWTGYAGGRAGLSWLFGKRIGHFELGASAQLDDDLSRQRIRYSFAAQNEDGGSLGTVDADHVIGMVRLGFGLELGGTHDNF